MRRRWKEVERTGGKRSVLSMVLCLTAVLTTSRLGAQVYEIQGGNSSLYQAGGGTLNITSSHSDLAIGAGSYAGHFMSGARLEQKLQRGTLLMGDDHLDLHLPTDLFDGSHYLYTRGVSLSTRLGGNDATLFAGTDLTTFSNPLFLGGKTGSALGFLSLHRRFSPHWDVFSETVAASKQTQILAAQWEPSRGIRGALSGGVGSNAPYAAASLSIKESWIDLKSSYIQASSGFHRFELSNPTSTEPVKGNLSVVLSPTRYLDFSGTMQNYLVTVDTSGNVASSSASEVGADLHLGKAGLAGTLYESKYLGELDHAGSAGLRWPISRRFRITSLLLTSRPQQKAGSSSLMNTVDETVSSRVTINQSVSLSNDSPTFYFGGTLQSNLLSVAANYETFYVPARTSNPFETALVLDVNFRFFGRYRIHGQTNLSPAGKLLYSADAYAMAFGGGSESHVNEDVSLGKSVLSLQVVDATGRPVEGAALLIDQRTVYTDSEGRAFLRENRIRTHPIKVDVDQFLAYGRYEVVSAPQTVSSTAGETVAAPTIVVRRIDLADSHAK